SLTSAVVRVRIEDAPVIRDRKLSSLSGVVPETRRRIYRCDRVAPCAPQAFSRPAKSTSIRKARELRPQPFVKTPAFPPVLFSNRPQRHPGRRYVHSEILS